MRREGNMGPPATARGYFGLSGGNGASFLSVAVSRRAYRGSKLRTTVGQI